MDLSHDIGHLATVVVGWDVTWGDSGREMGESVVDEGIGRVCPWLGRGAAYEGYGGRLVVCG